MRLTFIESDLSIYSEIYYEFEYIDDVFKGTIAHSSMLYTLQWNFFVNSNFITSYHWFKIFNHLLIQPQNGDWGKICS